METLFLNLLSLTGPVSALIALLYLLTPLMRKSYAAKWRQYMWIFCAVRLLLPVKLSSPSLYTIELPSEAVAAANTAAASAEPVAGIKMITVLSAVWLLGTAIFLSIQAVSYIAFRHSVKRWSARCENEEILNIFTVSKAAMGIKREIGLRICKKIKSPMVTGFLKPVLLLPHEDYSADEAEIIIRHELIHFKKHHLWYKLLLLLTESVSWFNPFAYIMFRAANKDMELACDDEVIKNADYTFRQKYCETILNGIHRERGRANVLTTCLNINKKMLLDRFGNILNMGVKKNGILICLAVSMSLIAGSAVISFAEGKVSEGLSEVFDYEPEPIIDAILPITATDVPTAAEPEYDVPAADNGGYTSYRATAPDYADTTANDYGNAQTPANVTDTANDNERPEQQSNGEDSYSGGTGHSGGAGYSGGTVVYSDDTAEPYVSGGTSGNGGVYADINIEGSRSFRGEEITSENSRTITVETSEGAINGADDSFTAYIRPSDDGSYEMVRTE